MATALEPQMNADERRSEMDQVSEKIIGCAFQVSNALGCGFLEKVYENAMAHELRKQGLQVSQQCPIDVKYDGVVVGDYVADIVVNNQVLIEVKAARGLDDAHIAQCLNYLKATGKRLCLLLNFGTAQVQVKRLVRNF